MKTQDWLIAAICTTMGLHLALASIRATHGATGGIGESVLTCLVLALVLIGGGQWVLAERGER